jgi:predicted transcriptional regulator
MTERRSKIESCAEILTVAKQTVLKQHIIQKCSLNNLAFNLYIKQLTSCRLLKASRGKQRVVYQTTSKGLEFLKRYNELLALFEEKPRTLLKEVKFYIKVES